MSVTLIVGSQTQLADGLPWLKRFAASLDLSPSIVVLGLDHKALARHASSALQPLATQEAVALVADDLQEVLAYLDTAGCRLALMVKDYDAESLQSALFERSRITTIWLRAKHDPPQSGDRIFMLNPSARDSTAKICQKLFACEPSSLLFHEHANKSSFDEGVGSEEVLAVEQQACEPGDLVLIGFGSSPLSEPHYQSASTLLTSASNASVALVSRKQTWGWSLSSRIRYWASHVAQPMDRDARLELARSLTEHSQPNLEFLGLISAAAMLAAFGLLQNSAAVIIGAMLIAPLMTPILGAGLSLTHGNRPLFQTSLLTIVIGFAGAFLSSFLFGLVVRLVQTPVVTPEMWGRCNPSPLDFCVGLVGGMAASYARTRSHLSSALAGAAIAAALVPPIATAGLQAAFGVWHSTEEGWPVFGPLLLVCVNVLTIMVGSSFVLHARGLRTEQVQVSGTAGPPPSRRGEKWATRMTVLLVALVLVVLVWLLHLERLFET